MDKERVNRDIPRFYDLIELITLLHQHIRPRFEHNGKKYVMASLEDFKEALEYSEGTLETTMKELDKDAEKILNEVKFGNEFTTMDIVAKGIFNYDKTYQILRQLESNGVIGSKKIKKEKFWFRVKDSVSFDNVCIKPEIFSLTRKEIEEYLTTTFDKMSFLTEKIIDFIVTDINLSNVLSEKGNDRKSKEEKKKHLIQEISNNTELFKGKEKILEHIPIDKPIRYSELEEIVLKNYGQDVFTELFDLVQMWKSNGIIFEPKPHLIQKA